MANYITRVVYIIVGLCCAEITSSAHANNETDALALLAFRASIVDPLGALSSWNKKQHYCNGKGIICGSKHPGRVVEINLMSQGLVGSLSAHVGNLSFLKIIILKNNTFHGQIPQEMGRLRRLRFVDFSNNTFVGEIPRNISECLNLVHLDLVDNRLSGNIPIELGFLLNLKLLKLRRNNIFGSIPPCLGNLTALVVLTLSECNLTGEIPDSLVQIQSLSALVLFKNSVSGRIPSGVFNISTLIVLSLSDNPVLEGVIPGNIGLTLPNLQVLQLGVNQLTGELPISLSNLTSLESVDLSSNSLTWPIPKGLERLSNLEYFVLTDNLIQDDISFISSFTNCSNLIDLGFSHNMFSGSLPNSMANISSQLWSLEISETQIHGNVSSGIGNLEGLTHILLNDNNLEGPISVAIGKLSNLRELFLEGNQFTDEIPHSLGNLTLLIHLNMQGNNLSGSIPQSLGNCSSLLSLDVGSNNLDGSIPAQIMSLSSISIYFSLADNGFTGSIPFEVGSLTHLSTLLLSNNRLSGVIPNTLSACTSLETLWLDGNLLEEELPPALSALTGLQDLDVSRNNLSGKIPMFLSHLNLENLNLSFNRLNGEVPIQGVFANKTAFSVEGNTELCGGMRELKLPPCSSSMSSKKHSPLRKILISTLVAGGFCIALCVCIFTYIYRHMILMKNRTSTDSFDGPQFLRLSYGDILKATDGFSDGNMFGAGRFGSVYRGILEDGKTIVAVKVLNLSVKGVSKGFIAECMALKGIKHRNLLKLLSVCDSIDFQRNEFKALVYEFMSNGSLEDLLYHNNEQDKEHDVEFRSLTMLQRLNIAIDIAHALEYRHFGTDSPVIHGDLKPSNVLLDNDMTAYVGDFGLSKIVSSMLETPGSSNTIGIRGTIGYIPPEYGTSNLASRKGDVYSYGILLLEMFTGKRPTDQAFNENLNLHDFVLGALPNQAMELVDPLILEGHGMNSKMKECVTSVLSIGVTCSRKIPMDRMRLTDVVYRMCEIRDNYML